MTPLTMLGCRVEKTDDGFKVTDHIGNEYAARVLNDGPTHALTLTKAGKLPGFRPKDKATLRNGVLCLIGR